MITIRNANDKDTEWIIHELRDFSKEFGTKLEPMGNDDYIAKLIKEFTDNHIFLVADGESVGLMGFIAGLVTPHIFNPNIMTICPAVWWVSKCYRNSRAGSMLLKKYIEIGKQKADWVILSYSRSCPIKDSTVKKLGFIETEKSFLMEGALCQ